MMSPELVLFIFGALNLYSFFLVRRAGEVQQKLLIPFLYRVHVPNVQETLESGEHNDIHDQIDKFNLRILACFLAAILALGTSIMFCILLVNEGDARWPGYISSVLFAFLGANYNLNSKVASWVRASESVLLSRVLQNKADAGGFDSLGEYLQAENDKMIKDSIDEMNRIAEEFMDVAEDCGFDPEKDYEESEDTIEEFYEIMDQAQKIMRERYPDRAETFDK